MKNLSKIILVRQHDLSDCGPACLVSVFAYYGLLKPISRVRFESGTSKNGTSLLGLKNAAAKEGFKTRPVKISDKDINGDDLPAIAHLNIHNQWYHFAVIYKKTSEGYLIMDPATGKLEEKNREEFNSVWTGILLILKPGKNFKKKTLQITTRRRFYSLLKSHKRALLKAVSGAIIYSILGVSTAKYIEYITDTVIPSGKLSLLNLSSIVIIAILILRILTGYFKNMVIIKSGRQIDSDLINNYNRHILNLPVAFFESMKTGEILTRINDAIKIRAFINSIAQEVIVNIIIVIVTISLMFSYSVKMSLILLFSVPGFLLVYKFLKNINRKHLRKSMELGAELESKLVETIKGVSTIKAFTYEYLFYGKLFHTCKKLLSTIFKTSRGYTAAAHLSELISSIWLILIIWAGSKQIINEKMSYGELFSFYSLYSYLSGPLISLILSGRGIEDARIAADRLFQIMDLEVEASLDDKSKDEITDKVSIEAKDLSFAYPGKLNILNDVSFRCESGSINALIGESGSGKSTLISLLMRFHRSQSGEIFFNQNKSASLDNQSLRRMISWIPQNINLFSGTLRYNICFRDEGVLAEKLENAIYLSGLGETFNKLKLGPDTYVSEDGNNFSGGEKQKIALARAIYADRPIFLLDEPSSSMDQKAERQLITALKKLRDDGKTILLVAHKLSLVSSADQILVLDEGRIVEKGQHNSLIEKQGVYYKIWQNQNQPTESRDFFS